MVQIRCPIIETNVDRGKKLDRSRAVGRNLLADSFFYRLQTFVSNSSGKSYRKKQRPCNLARRLVAPLDSHLVEFAQISHSVTTGNLLRFVPRKFAGNLYRSHGRGVFTGNTTFLASVRSKASSVLRDNACVRRVRHGNQEVVKIGGGEFS